MAARVKIRKGDLIEVTSGKDLGRRGKVLEVIPTENRVVVENINIAKKHAKPRPVKGSRGAQVTPGGVLDIAQPLRVDNVMLVCPGCDKPTRVGYRVQDDGSKVRVCKHCGKEVK